MSAIASQIISLPIVYSTVYSRHKSTKTSKLRVTGLCPGNSPVTGEFPAQRASNAENVCIWWRHIVLSVSSIIRPPFLLCQAAMKQKRKRLVLRRSIIDGNDVLVGRVASFIGLVWVSPTTCGDGGIPKGNGCHMSRVGTVIGGISTQQISATPDTLMTRGACFHRWRNYVVNSRQWDPLA